MARPFERLTSLPKGGAQPHPSMAVIGPCLRIFRSFNRRPNSSPYLSRREITLLADRHVIVVFLQSYSVQIGFFSRLKLFVAVQGRVVLLLHGFSLQKATAFLEEA